MPEPVQSLLISASLGALVGLLRQWEVQQDEKPQAEFAGLRTFAIVAMLGCLSAFVGDGHVPLAFPVTLGLLGLILVGVQFTRVAEGAAGYTTPGALILIFIVGGLVFWGARQLAVLVTGLLALLLALKQPIHEWSRRFTAQDIRSTLQFVAITGVILPLVPNRDFGPFEAFNPYSMWLMVVLISGLGFLGYILMRLLGNNAGVTLTGLVGGLASSTATTLAFSRRSKEEPLLSGSHALAVVLACTVMLVRVGAVVAAISVPVFQKLWLPLLLMALPGIAYAVWMWLGQRQGRQPVEAPAVHNPLSLWTAVKFGAAYSAVKFLVKAAAGTAIPGGVLGVSFIGGLTDVDAISVSMAESAQKQAVDTVLAGQAVILGCVSNTCVKAGIAATLGSPALRWVVLGVLGATALAGLGGLLLIHW